MNAIDIIPHNDLKMIGRIRNEFAHRYDVNSFNHVDVVRHLRKLKMRDRDEDLRADLVAEDPETFEGLEKPIPGERGRFTHALGYLATHLVLGSVTDDGWGAVQMQ